MPWRTLSMSTPTRSANRDRSFMKLMRVASMALAAYLVNSALRRSITSTRLWLRTKGRTASASLAADRLRSPSTYTTRPSARQGWRGKPLTDELLPHRWTAPTERRGFVPRATHTAAPESSSMGSLDAYRAWTIMLIG